jgi:hypothetical protein
MVLHTHETWLHFYMMQVDILHGQPLCNYNQHEHVTFFILHIICVLISTSDMIWFTLPYIHVKYRFIIYKFQYHEIKYIYLFH